jgi:hypothetical protein
MHSVQCLATGRGVIVVMPWDEWWELQLKDVADPHVALLPMHHDLRARFNQSAAWEYAQSMNGLPYGYHNMIFSWIDTWKRPPKHQEETLNPPPLDSNLVSVYQVGGHSPF